MIWMGIRRICVEGLSREEMDLVELRMREIVTQIGRAVQKVGLLMWREDEEESEEDGNRSGNE